MSDLWLELAQRVTTAEREHRRRAEELWRTGDVIPAVRERAIADGLEAARNLHLEVVAEAHGTQADPLPIDGAVFSVWSHGKWRWLTSKMTTEQREAAADAVERHDEWLCRQAGELDRIDQSELRWWRK